MRHINIGVIADDFTGASDAASFLVKGGNKTILLTDIPKKFDYDCDSVVVALKVRSVEPRLAVEEVSKVMDFFEENDVDKVYFKYCSTFDSTPKGNIGVIMDYLLERTGAKYSILCPSLPINGRKVKDGILYVNDVPLAESPLKDHPLNPMWDSSIINLMKPQSKYPCYIMRSSEITQENVSHLMNSNGEHFYIIPDYYDDEDGKLISKLFNDLKVLSGGSGLLEHLFTKEKGIESRISMVNDSQKAVIVCGSCSAMTNKQVQKFKETGNPFYAISAVDLLEKKVTTEQFQKIIESNQPKASLIYSDGCEAQGNLRRNSESFRMESIAMEQFLSDIAKRCQSLGYNKIVVAGGETSGAVTIKLGYNAFLVGESVAPGVPVLTPLDNLNMRLILKSGNFGDEDFFVKALEAR